MTVDNRLTQRIEDALADVGISAMVTVRPGTVLLEGGVESPEMRQAATDVVHEILPNATVDNQIEVNSPIVITADSDGGGLNDPFMDEVVSLDEAEEREALQGGPGAADIVEESAKDPGTAEPVFPPTDPVVRQSGSDLEVLGGFADTSLDEVAEPDDLGPLGSRRHERNDDEIAADIRRELREDAATTDLDVRVQVVDGVVRLTGTVTSLDDADAAEEVASRVPGVVEVDERLQLVTG